MASRNKKGKLHSIFTSQFDVTFFYKPSGDDDKDQYYYIVISDTIMIKARFIENVVLIIESAKSLTTSMTNKYYDSLVQFLKTCESMTVLVSAIGCCQELIQSCQTNGVPAVECHEFTEHSDRFYNRFKTYAHDDISLCGYFLLALEEKSFQMAKEYMTDVNMKKKEKKFFEEMQYHLDPVNEKMHEEKKQQLEVFDVEEQPPEFKYIYPEMVPLVAKIKDTYAYTDITPVGSIIPNTIWDTVAVTGYIDDAKHKLYSMIVKYEYGASYERILISSVRIDSAIEQMGFISMLSDLNSESSVEYYIRGVSAMTTLHSILSEKAVQTKSSMFEGNDYKII